MPFPPSWWPPSGVGGLPRDVDVEYVLGLTYLAPAEQNYAEAAYWFQRSADRGNELAQTALAHLYEDGRGVERDLTRARELYERAVAGAEAASDAAERLRTLGADN